MVCPPVREIIHSLKLVDYLLVQADKQWYNYYKLAEKHRGIYTHKPFARRNIKKKQKKTKNSEAILKLIYMCLVDGATVTY